MTPWLSEGYIWFAVVLAPRYLATKLTEPLPTATLEALAR